LVTLAQNASSHGSLLPLPEAVKPSLHTNTTVILSPQQKEENRVLSQSRVVCENAFAGVKRYNAVSAIYRNRKAGFDGDCKLDCVKGQK
jgi:hypothetical protein